MSEPVSTAQPAAAGPVSLSDEDLLALLDRLGGPDTHAPEADQEAIAAAEWEHLQTGQPPAYASPAWIGEQLPAGPGLAAMLSQDAPAGASDWDLPGIAAAYRRLAAWAQARELAAVAEIAARRALANPRIGADDDGRPAHLPPEAAAEVALELRMTQTGASAWTDLGCQLRWHLPGTGVALAEGSIDLGRARIIAEATSVLSGELAAAVEQRVLPNAGSQTTAQLRVAVRRAVLAADPDGAEERRKATERHATISLYPGEEGTATLTGSCLPGVQAAAAMARMTAMARALKASGARGGLDLLRAHIFIGLLLGTLPLIPPPTDGPPDQPPGDNGDDSSPPTDDAPSGWPGATNPPGNPPDRLPPDPEDGPCGPADDGGALSPDSARADADPSGDNSALGDARGVNDPGIGLGGADDRPGWWPDIPCLTDADAPPDAGDPPELLTSQPCDTDSDDDDYPLLPSPDWPVLPAVLPATDSAEPARDGGTLARSGLLDVLIPWSSLAGHSREPGQLGRIGPISSLQARQLLLLAVRNPATRWRIIVTGDDGRALAVDRVRPGRYAHALEPGATDTGGNVTGVIGETTVTIRASQVGAPAAAAVSECPPSLRGIGAAVLRAAERAVARARAEAGLTTAAGVKAGAGLGSAASLGSAAGPRSVTSPDNAVGGCAHAMASAAYRPPRRLREYVAARDKTCRFDTCGQPAWRTDLDHTIAWQRGGLTCSCNLGGCCRTHHKIKQLHGWHLDQPQPGFFRWTTPAGRSYEVGPDHYPV